MELAFLGDIMFGWKIKEKIASHGYAFPFEKLDLPVSENGFTIGNLETVVSDKSLKPIRLKNDTIVSPVNCIESLKSAGIRFVSLANNHIHDYGSAGLIDTLENLEKHGIPYVGAGKTRKDAFALKKVKCHDGITLGLLSRTFTCEAANKDFGEKEPQAAELLRQEFIETTTSARSGCDFLIILLHFGYEYCAYPDSEDVLFCRTLIDHGANLVIGHHPHVLQGMENYKNGLIAYSLGNFLFDNTSEDNPDTSRGAILKVEIESSGKEAAIKNYTLHPTYINEQGQVSMVRDADRENMLKRMQALSEKLLLNHDDYRHFSDAQNSAVILSIRKKEIMRYLKKGNIIYVLKKMKNIRWVHVRLFLRFLKSGFAGQK